uniref:NADH-ubiquinone oxidoreductase chain 1 n=4 Tax=Scarodytes TaxID=156916 RepID=A0A894JT41_9DYTI|nr:NADH dehydrogenase subunit 1 [Scarodytes malickyi]YP_010166789.1 NADH dehydrogenase subunit 1 [Scarodytes savinensis]QRV62880.1 NADH dehydrogenase subunit 1 [Scarodytes malickyi]QRV62893.1 NADH dehydrogenase subunit 1 [Scarodytes savinensis]
MFYKDIMVSFICLLLLVICVLVGVAFLTLLERKVLGYIQIRKGPNKVGFMGLPQPFSDAIKLFSKEQTFPLLSNYLMYYYSPVMSLFLSLLMWVVMPYLMGLFSFNLSMLFFLCVTSLGVYTLMIAGWSSNSSYSLLGGMRAVAQTISYEVSLSLIFMSFMIMVGSFSLMDFFKYQDYIWLIFLSLPLGFIWFVSSLAETNRTPFDFAEGESELVSGFNIEYSSGGFALIFLSEYSSILFMSMLFSVIFLGSNLNSLIFYFELVFISFMFIWVRGTLPRFRYDKLMYLAWKSFLPISLNYLFLYLGLKIFMYSLII